MSQCYQVQLRETVSRRVKGSDSVSYPISWAQILPEAEMTDLLRGVLAGDGWEADPQRPDVFTKRGAGGELLTADLQAGEITVTLEEEKEVSREITASARGESNKQVHLAARSELRDKAAATGNQLEELGEREVRESLRRKLEETEAARLESLHELMQAVYAEALKRKAGQMGDIMEIHESKNESGDYELVIRVAQP